MKLIPTNEQRKKFERKYDIVIDNARLGIAMFILLWASQNLNLLIGSA